MIDQYRAVVGLSGSRLGLLQCPAKFKHELDNPSEPTEAMILGSLRHCMLLEPDRVEELYYKLPEGLVRRAGKDYEALVTEAGDKVTVKHADWVEAETMVSICAQHAQVRPIISAWCKFEHELYWTESDVACKGKVDIYLPDLNVIVDYKTTNDASPRGFRYKVLDMGYLLQMAHYQRGVASTNGQETMPGVLVIAQETDAPYVLQVYSVPQTMIDEAHSRRAELLEVYKSCTSTGEWYGYSSGIMDI